MVLPDFTRKEKIYAALLFFVVANMLLPTLIFSFNHHKLPSSLLCEDGVYESVAAVCCLVASVIFLYSFLKFPYRVNYLLFSTSRNITVLFLSILLFVLFAEEISWGQRIFGVKTPDMLSAINFQREINLHNLKIIQSQNNLIGDQLSVLLVGYLCVLPLLVYCFRIFEKVSLKLGVPIGSLQIVLSVIFVRGINFFNYRFFYAGNYSGDFYRIGEAYESNLEMLLLVLALEYLSSCLNRQRCPSGESASKG